MLGISTVGLVPVPKRSALETPRRELSEDVSFRIGTVSVVEQSGLEHRRGGMRFAPSYTVGIVRYSLHQQIYDRHLLTEYYGYMVARKCYEETSLGIGNGILRGIMELGISGLWLGNILVIVVNGQLL